MKFTTRDLLWLAVMLAMGAGWYYHSTALWFGKAMAEDEIRFLNEEIATLRAELAAKKTETQTP